MRQPAEFRSTANEGSVAAARPSQRPYVTLAAAAERINSSWFKRGTDVVVSLLGLVAIAPLLLLIALAIRFDSRGPVLYRQERSGRKGTFRILKFRTMSQEASKGPFRQATLGDTRVTRVGRVLRRTNLDELPQLINVLLGDMSLVGPRPHPPALDERYASSVPYLMRRYAVRPGITGWAQVNGFRGETAQHAQMAGRVQHDLDYLRRWSPWFDLLILFRTLFHRKAFENAL